MPYNPKNEKPDTTSEGVTEGNKIWNLNAQVPQRSHISKIFIIHPIYNYLNYMNSSSGTNGWSRNNTTHLSKAFLFLTRKLVQTICINSSL